MARQEEIRKWFGDLFTEGWGVGQNELVIDHIFEYLHSQGVVIRVKGGYEKLLNE